MTKAQLVLPELRGVLPFPHTARQASWERRKKEAAELKLILLVQLTLACGCLQVVIWQRSPKDRVPNGGGSKIWHAPATSCSDCSCSFVLPGCLEESKELITVTFIHLPGDLPVVSFPLPNLSWRDRKSGLKYSLQTFGLGKDFTHKLV